MHDRRSGPCLLLTYCFTRAFRSAFQVRDGESTIVVAYRWAPPSALD
jgi:hypothetical protein